MSTSEIKPPVQDTVSRSGRLMAWLKRRTRRQAALLAGVALVLVGVADYLIGFEKSLLVFYLVPVGLAAWFVGSQFTILTSFACVVVWLVGDLAAGAVYPNRAVLGWNASIALLFFLAFAHILSRLRLLVDELEDRVRLRTFALTREINERARLETELLAVSEREQRRIGHELHDTLGQHLTGTALAGKVLASRLVGQEAVNAERVVSLLEQAIDITRDLARGLSPVEIEAGGLMDALHELAFLTATHHGINCRFDCESPVPIRNDGTAMQLFRIAQEAVSNALRHGHPHSIIIELSVESDITTRLLVRDDGVGLPESVAAGGRAVTGMGLRIMGHRAALIGGRISARRATPEAGTVISCTLHDTSLNGTEATDQGAPGEFALEVLADA